MGSLISGRFVQFIAFVGFAIVIILNAVSAFSDPEALHSGLQNLVRHESAITTIVIGILTVLMGLKAFDLPSAEPSTDAPIIYNVTQDEILSSLREPSLKYAEPMMEGPPVKRLQKALQDRGYDVEVDGVFGLATRKCVEKFQYDNGLTVDGIAGPETRAKLGILLHGRQ